MVYTQVPTNEYLKTSFQKASSWYIYFCGFSANLLLISVGTFIVWTSPVIPKLKSNDTEINPLGTPITTSQVSIIASMPFFSATFSYIILAHISDKLGRKKTIMYIALCKLVILITIAFASSIYVYYVCFILMGFVYAGCFINIPIYSVEISEDSNRGRMGCFVGLSVPFGILCGYIFGPLTSVRDFTLISAIPSALHLLLTYFIVETPIYLASVGKNNEAINSLERLRRPRSCSKIEIEFQKSKRDVTIDSVSFMDLFKTQPSRKAIYFSLLTNLSQQTSGISIILSFMAPIFNEAGSSLSGDTVGIIVGVIKVCFYLVAVYFVEKLGRRQLLLFSSVSCAISMFCLGCYFYLKHIQSPIIDDIHIFPVICAVSFIISYSLGLGPIPIAMMGELFETEFRASGTATVWAVDNIAAFTVLFSFPLLLETYGAHACFFTYSAAGIIGATLIFLSLPETRGRTLQEIQEILQNKQK